MEPLVVDPSRLKAAAMTLRGLAFPSLPSPIAVAGTDSVSAAINATLPVIESPVVDGLAAVKAAVNRTGSSIVAAANIYAETDQTLGDHVGKVQFGAAAEEAAGGASADAAAGAAANRLAAPATGEPAEGETPDAPDPAPRPAQPAYDQLPSQLGQVAAMAGAMAPVTQNMQTVMSTVQGATGSMGSVGASPAAEAQLVDETNKGDAEGEPQAEEPADGATLGDQALGSVPIQAPPSPATTPSERQG